MGLWMAVTHFAFGFHVLRRRNAPTNRWYENPSKFTLDFIVCLRRDIRLQEMFHLNSPCGNSDRRAEAHFPWLFKACETPGITFGKPFPSNLSFV
jgi:hypothetical protein